MAWREAILRGKASHLGAHSDLWLEHNDVSWGARIELSTQRRWICAEGCELGGCGHRGRWLGDRAAASREEKRARESDAGPIKTDPLSHRPFQVAHIELTSAGVYGSQEYYAHLQGSQ
jgi:hypothetical protein